MRPPLSPRWAALTLLATGCTAEPPSSNPETGDEQDRTESAVVAPDIDERSYERDLVFLGSAGDTLIIVPWLFSTRISSAGETRSARAWFFRSDTWETVSKDLWTAPASRLPWQILPHGDVRILVDASGELERLVFQSGGRGLELLLGDELQRWSGPRGAALRLREGSVVLANVTAPGYVVDINHARRTDEDPRGDWAFLASGDSLQMIVHSPLDAPPGTAGAYRAFARLDFRDLRWPNVTVDWAETGSFERARRDVPFGWVFEDARGVLSVELRTAASHLEAGEGDDPQPPVDGLFSVEGAVSIEGITYPVRGFLRHSQR